MFTYHPKRAKVPIKVWMGKEEYFQDSSLVEQVENAASLPFAFHHVALMPDGHVGFGAPIGGVLATQKVIVVNFVGVDIGCGMTACQTSLQEISRADLKKIITAIRKRIPAGFAHHRQKQPQDLMPPITKPSPVVEREFQKARKQLGTLGGGNHFIEIQKGDDGFVWFMIHSGSRNLGLQVANWYQRQASKWREKLFPEIPSQWQLDPLPWEEPIARQYWQEMDFCRQFAFRNRELMANWIKEIFQEVIPKVQFKKEVNIAHNYASWETHFGKRVIVHRKGATAAKKGQLGIIPGSQGTNSYIVEGKGNPQSFKSCSHGAGRRLSRNQARKQLNLQEEREKLDKQGIIHSLRSVRDLDEASSAYKDITQVMKNQKDLVKITTILRPLAVIKASS